MQRIAPPNRLAITTTTKPWRFDAYVVVTVDKRGASEAHVADFSTGMTQEAWNLARRRFLIAFNELKIPCRLVGRIFN